MTSVDPQHSRVVQEWDAVAQAVWQAGGDQITLPILHLRMILHVAGLALGDRNW